MTINEEVDRLEAILYDLVQIPEPTIDELDRIYDIKETLKELWRIQDEE